MVSALFPIPEYMCISSCTIVDGQLHDHVRGLKLETLGRLSIKQGHLVVIVAHSAGKRAPRELSLKQGPLAVIVAHSAGKRA